jgi:hypothetical protein
VTYNNEESKVGFQLCELNLQDDSKSGMAIRESYFPGGFEDSETLH